LMSMRGSRGLLVAGAVALALSAGALVVSNPNPDAFDTPQPRGHDGQRPSGQAKIEEHDQRTVEAVAHRASRALDMAWGWGAPRHPQSRGQPWPRCSSQLGGPVRAQAAMARSHHHPASGDGSSVSVSHTRR